ncbi:MAG: FeoA family protein [Planctomycetota bacterium]
MTTSLDNVTPGSLVRLLCIGGERSFRCRLMELGLLPGTLVRMIRKVDLGGVLELEVRGCRLSVRHKEASDLVVEVPGAHGCQFPCR